VETGSQQTVSSVTTTTRPGTMAVIETQIDRDSGEFAENRADMLVRIDEFRELEQRVRDASNAKRELFQERGQLLPRERLAMLLDRGAPFLELSTLAGYKMHDDDGEQNVFGGGLITGIGYVSGVRSMIYANDSGIKGGTSTPMGGDKTRRAQSMALEQKLPLISLVQSGGANLFYQSETFIQGGRRFANQARLSAAGVPQVTVVHGNSTAGGAYVPGMSDYVIMVRNQAKVFLAGPPLLKAATGEIATDEDLGGAKMHATVSGTAEYMAEDDAEAIERCREVMARLAWNDALPPESKREFKEPRYDIDELAGAVPVDYRKPHDCREVVARIVDGSDFLEFKALYDIYTICGHASVEGQPVGIIGNNGPITPEGSVKAAQFIQLCCQSDTPLVFLQNTTGYIVGTEAETGGIVKHGSKMIQAVANAHVPRITFHIGASFGAGNYGMCGRGFDPDFIFTWPSARIAVMGGEQAAGTMRTVREGVAKRRGEEPDTKAIQKMYDGIVDQFDAESTALFATARLWDDGLIDPRDTRRVLAMCLSIARESRARPLNPNTFGVARL